MYDAYAVNRTDVWATGNAQSTAMVNHWDGRRWTRVDTPPAQPGDTEFLRSVDGTGTDDVWAVGYSRPGGCCDTVPLIEHWDGTTWTKVPYELPHGNIFGTLRGVTAVAPDDAWAVGRTYGELGAPLILHWDGHTWEPVTDIVQPTAEASISTLYAVDAIAADDIWAVGSGNVPVLLHWDGQVWTRHRSPTRDRDWILDAMYGITAVTSDDVWAVGGYADDFSPDRTRILHWDGHTWERVRSPNPGRHSLSDNALYAVTATGPNNAWAVGYYSRGGGRSTVHLYTHWDGNRWTRTNPNQAPVSSVS